MRKNNLAFNCLFKYLHSIAAAAAMSEYEIIFEFKMPENLIHQYIDSNTTINALTTIILKFSAAFSCF